MSSGKDEIWADSVSASVSASVWEFSAVMNVGMRRPTTSMSVGVDRSRVRNCS